VVAVVLQAKGLAGVLVAVDAVVAVVVLRLPVQAEQFLALAAMVLSATLTERRWRTRRAAAALMLCRVIMRGLVRTRATAEAVGVRVPAAAEQPASL
jgi:hypothetical protein